MEEAPFHAFRFTTFICFTYMPRPSSRPRANGIRHFRFALYVAVAIYAYRPVTPDIGLCL